MNENVIRSLSGLVYIFILLFATLFSKESFLVLFAFFLLQTVNEFSSLILLPKLPSIIIAILLYSLFGIYFSVSYIDVFLVVTSLLICIKLIFWLFNQNTTLFNSKWKWLILIGYIIFPFVLLVKIPMVNNTFISSIIIGIFILIWTNDTFAYIVGKSIGKNKLFEVISPKKTIEGFIGGILFSIIASIFIAKYYTHMPVYIWVVTSVIVGVFGALGDLVESKFKRVANVKDSGKIMPGHGGIFDRLDSVIFVAPFLFLVYKIIGYVS
jgi:phosphatidate cytidylyltransferase